MTRPFAKSSRATEFQRRAADAVGSGHMGGCAVLGMGGVKRGDEGLSLILQRPELTEHRKGIVAGAFTPPAAERGAQATIPADVNKAGDEVFVLLWIIGSTHESREVVACLRAVGFFPLERRIFRPAA